MAVVAARLTDEAFTLRICVDWARRMGIHLDLARIAVRTVSDGGFAGRGIYATQPTEPGEFFAIIPQSATLQAPDLTLSTRRYFADLVTNAPAPMAMPTSSAFLSDLDAAAAGTADTTLKADIMEERDMAEAFGRGFQLVARGADTPMDDLPVVGLLDVTKPSVHPPSSLDGAHSFWRASLPPLTSEERDWWLLSLVVALERRRGLASQWWPYLRHALPQECLMDVSLCFQHQLTLLARGRLPSPETSMKPPSRNESPLIVPLSPKGFTEMRAKVQRLESIRNGYAWRFAALFNVNLASVARGRGYSGVQPTLLRPSDLRWAMDMVTSRANNFSFFQSTDRPRPYGFSPEPIPGATSTLCPFFDLLNHSMDMNVIVADVKLGDPTAADDGQQQQQPPGVPQQTPTEERPAGEEWTRVGPSARQAGLIIGSLGKLKAGEELCYVYNAPVVRNTDTGTREVDVAGAIARWGFLPPPPLT
jgi:hypothetical protein